MRRGSVVVVSAPGDYGKPRPAVVVQNSRLLPLLDSIVVALLTTSPEGGERVRVRVEPNDANGLRETSRVMVNKLLSFRSHRVSEPIGELDEVSMARIDDALRLMLDLQPRQHPRGSPTA